MSTKDPSGGLFGVHESRKGILDEDPFGTVHNLSKGLVYIILD